MSLSKQALQASLQSDLATMGDLVKNKAIPDELAAKLPKSDVPVSFPTIDQITKVSEQIKTGWPEKVGLAYAAS